MTGASKLANPKKFNQSDNTIGFLDMDSFELQLYLNKFKKYSGYRGTPCIVVADKGRIVSISHEAKAFGITREIRLEEALVLYPGLNVITKPIIWDKPDAQTPRHGSWQVLDTLKQFCKNRKRNNIVLEYASSDGFYVDLTEEIKYRMNRYDYAKCNSNVIIMGHRLQRATRAKENKFYYGKIDQELLRLMHGAEILAEMSEFLHKEINMACSGGVASNKMVAKMACLLNKPGKITVLPVSGFEKVREKIDVSTIPGFERSSSTFAEELKAMPGLKNLEILSGFSLRTLELLFGKEDDKAQRLYDGARGICKEKVVAKDRNNVITAGKTFHGDERMMHDGTVRNNLRQRAFEFVERLGEEKKRHNRTTESVQVKFEYEDKPGFPAVRKMRTFSISSNFPSSSAMAECITQKAFEQICDAPGIKFNPTMVFTNLAFQAAWKPYPQTKEKEQLLKIMAAIKNKLSKGKK